jgi:carboxyl-terminal processing protease
MIKLRNIAIMCFLLLVVGTESYKLGQRNSLFRNGNQLDLSMMWKVKKELEIKYLDKSKIDSKKMEYGAISGMVSSLDDPYTVYLSPEENKSANEDLAGTFGGVGISLGYKDKTLAVMTPLPKTPAAKAGILAGDLILKIIDKKNNVDRDTVGISLDEAVKLIRGEVGTEVTLKLYREGEKETFEVNLKRDNIVVPSIEMEWVTRNGKKFAWVKLYKFTELIYKEWPETVANILKAKDHTYGGIVLDLRNNPGGFLQASVLVASDFIKSGTIVTQESSDGSLDKYNVDKSRNLLLNDNLVVLINGGSASASEILAGALKEYGRAKLVGEKTFGKGTVQSPENYEDGSGLHITIAKWLLPNGKNIHKDGVEADVEEKYVVNTKDPKADNQLEKAIDVLLN